MQMDSTNLPTIGRDVAVAQKAAAKAEADYKAFGNSMISSDEHAMDWLTKNRTLEPEKASAVMGAAGLDNKDIDAWDWASKNAQDPKAIPIRNAIFDKLAKGRVPVDETKGYPALNRIVVGNLADEGRPDLIENYFKDRGFETRVKFGKVEIKKPDEPAFYGYEPTKMDKFDFAGWMKEKALDVADLAYPLVQTGAVIGATGAKALGSLGGPIGVAGTALVSGATTGGVEAARQGLGYAVGLRDKIDTQAIQDEAASGFFWPGAIGVAGLGLKGAGNLVGKAVDKLSDYNMRPDAAKIQEAAKELGATATPAQLSQSPGIQKLEESFVKGGNANLGGLVTGLPNQVEANRRAVQQAADEIVKARSFADPAVAGSTAGKQLTQAVAEKLAPAEAIYSKYEQAFKQIVPDTTDLRGVMDDLAQEFKFNKEASSFIKSQAADLDKIQTLDDLRKFRTATGKYLETMNEPRAAKLLYDAATKARTDTLVKAATDQGIPQAADELRQADQIWRTTSQQVDNAFVSRSAPMTKGPKATTTQFFEKNKEVDAIRKVLDTNDPAKIAEVKKAFPEQFDLMRTQVIEDIASRAEIKGQVNPSRLANIIDKLPDESKTLIFGADAAKKAGALKTYLDSIPLPFNASNTANMLEFNKSLWNIPAQLNSFARGVYFDIMANTQIGKSMLQRSGDALMGPTAAGLSVLPQGIYNAPEFGRQPQQQQPAFGR